MNTNEELRARICSLEIQLNRSKREIDQQREEFLSKGTKTNNMLCDADARIAELQRQHGALVEVTRAALDWIDAVPEDTVLPAMPGFDRDWAEQALADVKPAGPEVGE